MKPNLALACMLAMTATNGIDCSIGGRNDPFERKQEPMNNGRRAEKDAEAKRRAQAKRDRKNANRVASASHNVELRGASDDATTK